MNLRKNNKGTTLVEVTCGFLLLVVAMTAFIRIIKLSSELTSAAVKTKENSSKFEELYFNGSNYEVKTDKSAFRKNEEMDVPIDIVLTEWTPDGKGYFNEWYKNGNGKMESPDSVTNGASTPGSKSVTLKNVKLKRIENIYEASAAKICVFRYVREETAVTP